MLHGSSVVTALAPGAHHNTRCAVEQAKANLQSSCVRYLFLDDLKGGMGRLRRHLPDLAKFGTLPVDNEEAARNGSWNRLSGRDRARLANYTVGR